MSKEKLFHVQDSDRPMFVVARNYSHALRRWKKLVKRENGEVKLSYVKDPDGINMLCDSDELIL